MQLLGVGKRRNSQVRLRLDDSPSGEEEEQDFPDQRRAMGVPYDEDDAKHRIDSLARNLARVWTVFLMYIVIAQGVKTGISFSFFGREIHLVPKFDLETGEFIAVFTTTTASVFAFLLIVANYLFNRSSSE